jgi:hypothetical protein
MKKPLVVCISLLGGIAFAQLASAHLDARSRAQAVPLVVSATVESEEAVTRNTPENKGQRTPTPCPNSEQKDCYLMDLGNVRASMGGTIYHLKVTEVFKYPGTVSAPTTLKLYLPPLKGSDQDTPYVDVNKSYIFFLTPLSDEDLKNLQDASLSGKPFDPNNLYATRHAYDAVTLENHKADVEKLRALAAKRKLG